MESLDLMVKQSVFGYQFRIEEIDVPEAEDAGEEDPLPQRSDRFTDANMWVVDQNVVNPNADYQALVNAFDRLFDAGVSQ